MAHQVFENVAKIADDLRARSAEAEKIGRLTDEGVRLLKDAGVIRMLQPKEHGGFEAHPREFAETVMAVARACPASGWVCGVVGVHPWQLAYADPRVQEEVWGDDPTIWMASPYMPSGVAVPVDGGYRFSGRWQFSSGTDHCDWVFLGGLLGNPDGTPVDPPQQLHLILPRSDYEIVDDSWDVVGLRGTGSKDVIVRDAFVPDYRVMDAGKVMDGSAAREAGRDEPLYLMPWSCLFPLGITASVIGIAEGALEANLDYHRERISAIGTRSKEDPYVMFAVGEASADIAAARAELLANVDRIYDIAASGRDVPFEERAVGRRTQVRAAWRAVRAIDDIFGRAGGNALRMDKPMQRYWRDAHAGLNHAIHVPGPAYHAAALTLMGVEPEGALRFLI